MSSDRTFYPLNGHYVQCTLYTLYMCTLIYYRVACGIPLGDHVVITGGVYALTRVSKYDDVGTMTDMPSLQQGRYSHGCTSFLSGGQQVRLTT